MNSYQKSKVCSRSRDKIITLSSGPREDSQRQSGSRWGKRRIFRLRYVPKPFSLFMLFLR